MRIRRRHPGTQPLLYLLPSDPYPAPQSSSPKPPAPPPPGDWDKQGEGDLHPASAPNDSAADLGDAAAARSSSSSPLTRPALPFPPQDDGAVEQRSRDGRRLLGAQQEQQQGPADGRRSSLENGLHRHMPEPATNQAGELRLSSNGVVGAAVVAVTTTTSTTASAMATKQQQQQQEKKDTAGGGGTKRERAPRGPGTLMEGSRCSRKNGRGWRCSQPTQVGYALCQYHLGKGRMKSGSAGSTVGRGPGQLGRTEHANKKTSTAAVVPVTAAAAAVVPATASAAAPKADVPPPPTSVQGV